MNIPERIDDALRILAIWAGREDLDLSKPMHKRTALRWKAYGIVTHDRVLNYESVPMLPMRTLSQVIGMRAR